ncbi:hypothetical protein FB451DRAFT_1368038 [Mycena latifolia]|nr:hypothetical protein FB451DRAFT_1368038 [Mycena latifolia]
MPKINHTIDNVSPLITYSSNWREGGSDDSLISNYSNGTFTLSDTQGSYATFTFNGTAIWVYGAKRPNHGTYSVALDNNITVNDGFSSDSIIQTPLFMATNLADTTHSMTITNQETNASLAFLDLDFITWTNSIGKAGETVAQDLVEDTSSAFSYKPAGAWVENSANLTGFSSNTGHSTFSNASVTYTFVGDEVTLYGAVGPNLAPYTVSLDNGTATSYNATKANYAAQVPLYHASDLGSGVHTIKVTNNPQSFGQALSIDYAITANVPSISTTSTSDDTASSSKSKLGAGATAGIVVGVVAFLAALILSGYFCWRRRHRKCGDTEKSGFVIDGSLTPTPFIIAPDAPNPSGASGPTPSATPSVSNPGPVSESDSIGRMSGFAAPTTISTLQNPWSVRNSMDTSAGVSDFSAERRKWAPTTSTPSASAIPEAQAGGSKEHFAESPPDYQQATQSVCIHTPWVLLSAMGLASSSECFQPMETALCKFFYQVDECSLPLD